MAGDLEDFLKRAAERRAQKQQQAGGGGGGGARPTPRPQPKPQYTESRRERQIRQPPEDAIPIAELVEPVNPMAEKEARIAAAQVKSETARQQSAQRQRDIHEPAPVDRGVITISGGSPAEQLLDLIRRPSGIQQAFLLREILERPEERWG